MCLLGPIATCFRVDVVDEPLLFAGRLDSDEVGVVRLGDAVRTKLVGVEPVHLSEDERITRPLSLNESRRTIYTEPSLERTITYNEQQ